MNRARSIDISELPDERSPRVRISTARRHLGATGGVMEAALARRRIVTARELEKLEILRRPGVEGDKEAHTTCGKIVRVAVASASSNAQQGCSTASKARKSSMIFRRDHGLAGRLRNGAPAHPAASTSISRSARPAAKASTARRRHAAAQMHKNPSSKSSK
jgi:hypothetical protein